MKMKNFQNSNQKIQRAIRFLENDMKTIMGTEAVNHFKSSFQNQGFEDKGVKKWEEVERRKSTSKWHGFQYGSTVARPGTTKRSKNSQTNYSPAATRRPILSGQTQELMNSITYTRTPRGVRVFSNVAYAKVQNQGGKIKIFGKAAGTIPARQFMGKSQVLREKIKRKVITELSKILR